MNTPMQAMDQGTPNGAFPTVGTAVAHTLPQAGARPLVFNGSELAMAMSYTPALPYWYEINLYHSESQEFIVAIRKFFQSESENDQVNSWAFPDIETAMAHIETYDPAVEVLIPEMDAETMTPAEMSAMALMLKAEVEALRYHYSGLVGELFMEMEAADGNID